MYPSTVISFKTFFKFHKNFIVKQVSDRYPQTMKSCEILAKLVCHASLLKTDDVRLKRLHRSARTCALCDLYEEDNVRHLVMQCPSMQTERTEMFNDLRNVEGG